MLDDTHDTITPYYARQAAGLPTGQMRPGKVSAYLKTPNNVPVPELLIGLNSRAQPIFHPKV